MIESCRQVNASELIPGMVVSVPAGPLFMFRHLGIVSDQWADGMPMVISNSQRAGAVTEEPWQAFSAGRYVRAAASQPDVPGWAILAKARSLLGTPWNLLNYNCEHFVANACGLPIESPQLRRWGTGCAILIGLTLVIGSARGGGGRVFA